MRRPRTWGAFRSAVAERRQVEAGEQVLPGAEQDGRHGEVHLVDQAGLQILTNGGDAATDANVVAAGRGPRTLQRRVDAPGDEVEDSPGFHLQGRPLVVRENKNG